MIFRHLRSLAIVFVAIALFGGAEAAEKLHFVMVTHGAATDPFWAAIKKGADTAADESAVTVAYRAPATFDLAKMAGLLDAAVKEKPDGLIVSIPNADAVAAPIRAAVDAGIPVVTINSGFDVSRSLGALLHVGQSEYEAGRVAGDTMRKLGGTKALCINHELGNVGLDLRCKGFIDGFVGSVEVMPVDSDPKKAGEAIAKKLADDTGIDVALALNATIAGEPAVAAAGTLPSPRKVRIGSFDVTPEILKAVASGGAAFAVDQQPFLQGYLPVQYLTLLKRDGVIPVSNVSTGPRLITMSEARKRLGLSEAADGASEETTPDAPVAPNPSGG
jgi:simple sugar transport system substrate-binding protein